MTHNIVILEPLPFDDSHIAQLRSAGNVTAYPHAPVSEEEMVERLRGQHIVITGWCHLTRSVLEKAEDLKCISLWAAGCDYVDQQAAGKRGVSVFTAAGYASIAVAEFTIGTILTLLRRINEAVQALRQGVNSWHAFQGRDLHGKTVGVIGCGAIAQQVMQLLSAFGAHILCNTRHPEHKDLPFVTFVDLETLLRTSDVVTLHVPLTADTRHMLNRERIAAMKKGAIVVNTARGGVVDENALLDAVQSGHLGGAALDVFSIEPPVPSAAWFEQRNMLLTPHIAFNSAEAMEKKNALCIANVLKFCATA